MNIKLISITLILHFLVIHLKAQSTFETDSVKLWQPNTRIIFSDFKGDTTNEKAKKYKDNIGLLASSNVSVGRYLDIPKKKKNRGKMLEKAYFVPRWVKYNSYSFTTDSFEIAKQRLYFDMAEMICRMARRDIDSIQNYPMKAYGTLYITYVDIANHYCSKLYEFHRAYTQEVFVKKEEKAYEKWRAIIDDQLIKLEKYATQPMDCQRFITGQPVDKDYILSPTIYGELKKCN